MGRIPALHFKEATLVVRHSVPAAQLHAEVSPPGFSRTQRRGRRWRHKGVWRRWRWRRDLHGRRGRRWCPTSAAALSAAIQQVVLVPTNIVDVVDLKHVVGIANITAVRLL